MFLRYQQITRIVHAIKPKTIVEIGTWQGDHAILMVSEALRHHRHVHYWGFDLFEDASDTTDANEFNVRSHHDHAKIIAKLVTFQSHNPGFTFDLIRGDSRETLPKSKMLEWQDPETGIATRLADADFAYIDGGHSIETIEIDYEALKHCQTIVFDDYYVGDENGSCPDISLVGCNQLVNSIEHILLPAQDALPTGGRIQIVGAGVKFLEIFQNEEPQKTTIESDTKFSVVTTFSDAGYYKYGKRFIETFEAYWPDTIELYVYYETIEPELQSPRIHYINFSRAVPALVGFKYRHLSNSKANGFMEDGTEDYRFNAVKFCHKVFALTHSALTIDADILFWIDADSHTFRAPSYDFLRSLLPEDIYTCYLGRRNMHSECGFMGFDLQHSANQEFMEFWLSLFDEDLVFELPEWHDSYVYDVIRQFFEGQEKITSHDLRAGIEDDHHPFLNSPLGDYFDHLIGVRRKEAGTSFAADIRSDDKESRWNLVPVLPEDLIEKLSKEK